MITPRLLLALALSVFSLGAFAQTAPVPAPEKGDTETALKELPPLRVMGTEAPAIVVSAESVKALEKLGWKTQKDGSLERIEGGPEKGLIPAEYLRKADIKWREGALYFANSPYKVRDELLAPILNGLRTFTDTARTPRKEAGMKLAAWGLPPSVDGRRLYNAGGDATYYGMILHYFFKTKPEQVAALGVQRTSQALSLIDHAYGQAFHHQRPDIAQTDLDRARLLLFAPPRAGETPLLPGGVKARPDPTAMLADYKKKLEAELADATKVGDDLRRKDSAEALAVLNALEKQRFHASLDLTPVPPPGGEKKPPIPGGPYVITPFGGEDPAKKAPYVELATGLPGVLRTLERLGPMSDEQKENLIRSFPMGDLVWRMGAQNLWAQGLTGKGVKVAVIAENPELKSAVKDRVNFTAADGVEAVGSHGTHVSGIIHALAPDAELRGYAVFQGGSFGGNDRLRENPEKPIIDAIHRAVKDGNMIINMSLGSGDSPGAEMARVVEEYAKKGVVFVIAAGNSRNYSGGIDAPSSAPSAVTVGALDSAGRMSDFTNFGDRFDPKKLTSVVKEVFMTPGSNIVSTMPPPQFSFMGDGGTEYASMSGTSMATPALAGVSALLVQDMTIVPNPVNMAERLKSALRAGGEPISLDKLPPNVPIDQPFIVVNPLKALESLRKDAVPVVDNTAAPLKRPNVGPPKKLLGPDVEQ
ncbi:MAG: S8 family peptidase [Elusimicrobia bacterium]|nr:S8 family peptidase [Elusimicrobiota bacterium]